MVRSKSRTWTPGGDGGFDDDGGAEVSGEVGGFAVDGGAAGLVGAGAEAVGEVVLLQEAGEALDFSWLGAVRRMRASCLMRELRASIMAGMEP